MWVSSCFFFNDTATTEIYTLSLHDALPICSIRGNTTTEYLGVGYIIGPRIAGVIFAGGDRKSTRLNSSHSQISYAVFCLKKKTMTADPPGVDFRTRSHPATCAAIITHRLVV